MASHVLVNCDGCGDRLLPACSITPMLRVEDLQGWYTFRCPGCMQITFKLCSEDVLDLLEQAGSAIRLVNAARESIASNGRAPLTHDDIIDFHEFLTDVDRFDHARSDLRTVSPSDTGTCHCHDC